MSILLSQSPKTLNRHPDDFGMSEYDYVEKNIRLALQIISEDLRHKAHKFTVDCNTLDALASILSCKHVFYEESSVEVRMEKILVFQRIKGFSHLAIYFNARSGTTQSIPDWSLIHRIIEATHEGIVFLQHEQDANFMRKFRRDAMNVAGGMMMQLIDVKSEELARVKVDNISDVLNDFTTLFENLAIGDHKAMPKYFSFCQDIILKLLSTESNKHKEFGRALLLKLIKSIHSVRPLISTFVVKRCGLGSANGIYTLSAFDLDKDGYIIPGLNPRYERTVKGTNQKLMLFLDTDKGSFPHWCLSEEHGNEAILSEYTDYYTNIDSVSRTPPLSGWKSEEDKYAPAPAIESVQDTVPVRKEHKGLKKDLAKWFLENNLIKLVIGADIKCCADSSSVSNLAKAIDDLIDREALSNNTSNLFLSILPSISSQSSSDAPPQSIAPSNDGTSAIEAARLSLASAERWQESTTQMLLAAQKENDAAAEMVEKARQYLKSLEEKDQQASSSKPSRKANSVEKLTKSSSVTSMDVRKQRSKKRTESRLASSFTGGLTSVKKSGTRRSASASKHTERSRSLSVEGSLRTMQDMSTRLFSRQVTK